MDKAVPIVELEQILAEWRIVEQRMAEESLRGQKEGLIIAAEAAHCAALAMKGCINQLSDTIKEHS